MITRKLSAMRGKAFFIESPGSSKHSFLGRVTDFYVGNNPILKIGDAYVVEIDSNSIPMLYPDIVTVTSGEVIGLYENKTIIS